MDVERLTMVYPDVAAITRDLKVIGARNATAARARGLTGKGRWRAMTAAYETQRQPSGLLPATYEVVYGAAWGARGRPARRRPCTVRCAFPCERHPPVAGNLKMAAGLFITGTDTEVGKTVVARLIVRSLVATRCSRGGHEAGGRRAAS